MAEDTATIFDAFAVELESRFAADPSEGWPRHDFEAMAMRVFEFQFAHNEPYRALCVRRGSTPDTVESWMDTPPVPAAAFKHFDLTSVEGPPEATFLTSGTTGQIRGRHHVPRLSLYRSALRGPFHSHLIGEGGPTRFLSLIPESKRGGESSLAFMVSDAADAFAVRADFAVDGDGALDLDLLRSAVDEAIAVGEPVLWLGTALSFVHLVDRSGDRTFESPAGSRLMETGGFKGAGRSVGREELYRSLERVTGVPKSAMVNEYGMTELLSQLYDPDGQGHVAPPWLAVRVLDPESLDPLGHGEVGVLSFFDLANLGSVSHLLTQDLGSVDDQGRLTLVGRELGSEPRGCSRAMDELMSAAR